MPITRFIFYCVVCCRSVGNGHFSPSFERGIPATSQSPLPTDLFICVAALHVFAFNPVVKKLAYEMYRSIAMFFFWGTSTLYDSFYTKDTLLMELRLFGTN